MEKNQHNTTTKGSGQEAETTFLGSQPGQQLPAGAPQGETGSQNSTQETEQHSESSFPRQEGETLGTP